jgi:hypothetical protein
MKLRTIFAGAFLAAAVTAAVVPAANAAPAASTAPAISSYFHLVNGNGKCLGIAAGSTANGADAVQWACVNAPNQSWGVG